MNRLADTLINIELFVFIALMIWLYMRPSALEKEKECTPVEREDKKPE